MVDDTKEMRFSLSPFADQDERPSLVRPDCFNCLEYITRWIRDLQELIGGNLCGTGFLFIRELYRRASQALPLELFA